MTPNRKILTGLAVATASLIVMVTGPVARAQMSANGAELITNGPQTDPGDRSGPRSAAQNVRDSHNYEALVRSNPNFRSVREQKECGSIDDVKMHAQCLGTFER